MGQRENLHPPEAAVTGSPVVHVGDAAAVAMIVERALVSKITGGRARELIRKRAMEMSTRNREYILAVDTVGEVVNVDFVLFTCCERRLELTRFGESLEELNPSNQ